MVWDNEQPSSSYVYILHKGDCVHLCCIAKEAKALLLLHAFFPTQTALKKRSATCTFGNVQVGQILNFFESIGAMLRSFLPNGIAGQGGINKDPTVWLDGVRPPPKYA